MSIKSLLKGLIFATSSIIVLTGCGESTNEATGSSSDMNVEVVAKGFTQQYWTAVKNGAQGAADELNVNINFVGPKNETAVQEQVQMLSNAVNKNPNAIALASLDTNSQIDLLQQAEEKGIPVIGFDSGVPGAPEGSVAATAATNNKSAASMAAEKVFEALENNLNSASSNSKVRIGILSQEVNSQSISDRTEGFIEAFEEMANRKKNFKNKVAIVGHEKFNNGVSEKDANLIIQVQVPSNATDSEVQTTAQALLNKNDLVGVFATNETASKGLINANEAMGGILGDDGIIAAGFDSGKLQKEAVSNGTFIGSVTQDPITIGYNAVKLAVDVANGEEAEDMDIPATWYNAENIDSTDIAPLLYD